MSDDSTLLCQEPASDAERLKAEKCWEELLHSRAKKSFELVARKGRDAGLANWLLVVETVSRFLNKLQSDLPGSIGRTARRRMGDVINAALRVNQPDSARRDKLYKLRKSSKLMWMTARLSSIVNRVYYLVVPHEAIETATIGADIYLRDLRRREPQKYQSLLETYHNASERLDPNLREALGMRAEKDPESQMK